MSEANLVRPDSEDRLEGVLRRLGPTPAVPQRRTRPQHLAAALVSGRHLNDARFDEIYPREIRALSASFWTPVEVGVCAGLWLRELGARRVVDVGAGAGKFCIVGSFTCDAEFIGVEHRSWLVNRARAAASIFSRARKVRFVQAVVGVDELPRADVFFLENLLPPERALAADVERSESRYLREIDFFDAFLARAPEGTVLLTYGGYGSRPPLGYVEVRTERSLPSVLTMWRRDK